MEFMNADSISCAETCSSSSNSACWGNWFSEGYKMLRSLLQLHDHETVPSVGFLAKDWFITAMTNLT